MTDERTYDDEEIADGYSLVGLEPDDDDDDGFPTEDEARANFDRWVRTAKQAAQQEPADYAVAAVVGDLIERQTVSVWWRRGTEEWQQPSVTGGDADAEHDLAREDEGNPE